jgi:uncharacterized membrane protein YjfL (UPF0719 family)
MDWSYPLLILAQLVIAVFLGAVAIYLSVLLFDRATQGIEEWDELTKGNVAIGIVLGAMVVAVAWMLRPALKMPISGWDVGASRAVIALGVEAVQLLVGLILSVLSILFAVWLFDRLTTNVEEWAELKRGNIAVAALLAGVIIAVALLVGIAMESMFGLVTPYLF